MGVDRIPVDVRLTKVGSQQGRQHPHGRGLARSVGADEAEDIPLVELQVDLVGGNQVAVPLGEFAGLDQGQPRRDRLWAGPKKMHTNPGPQGGGGKGHFNLGSWLGEARSICSTGITSRTRVT